MIKPLNLDSGLEEIGETLDHYEIAIEPKSTLMKTLRKLQRLVESGANSDQIEKVSKNARLAWNRLGVWDAIDRAAEKIHEPEVDRRLFKHLVWEWAQNAVEHGAHYNGTVRVETFGGRNGVLVSVHDNGKGIEDLDERIKGPQLYSVDYLTMGRGFGLRGTVETSEIAAGFEKDDGEFRVNLLLPAQKSTLNL